MTKQTVDTALSPLVLCALRPFLYSLSRLADMLHLARALSLAMPRWGTAAASDGSPPWDVTLAWGGGAESPPFNINEGAPTARG